MMELSSLCSRLGNQKHRNLKTPCIGTLSNHVNAFLGKFLCCIQPQQHQSEHCDNGQSISVCETKQTEHKSCVTTMTKSNPACGVGNDISNSENFCRFCGHEEHERKICPARNDFCGFCSKRGHFQIVCERQKRLNINKSVCNATPSPALKTQLL